jgi:hypothetical protein
LPFTNNDRVESTMVSKDANTEHRRTYEMIKWPVVVYSILAIGYLVSLPGKWIWFSWHPLAMILSFVTLAINGAMIKKIGGYDNTVNHGKIMNLALAAAFFGWYVIYSNKEMNNKQHLTTLHAKLGVVCMLGYIAVGLVGLAGLHPDWGFLKTNKTLRFAHKWTGRGLTALAWYVCVLGFAKMQSELWKQLLFGLPLLVAGFIVLV